jgi:hypothetical protein
MYHTKEEEKYYRLWHIHQIIEATCSHALHCLHCHYWNVDFVLFHNVTCYTNPLLSCIHVNITNLLNIMCTFVATCVILGRLKCSCMQSLYSWEVASLWYKIVHIWWSVEFFFYRATFNEWCSKVMLTSLLSTNDTFIVQPSKCQRRSKQIPVPFYIYIFQ